MPTFSAERPLELGGRPGQFHPTLHNGPGWRIPLWLQGCSLRCTRQCLSPHLLVAGKGHVRSVGHVASQILETVAASDVPVAGVTILGGEPTDQAAGVLELVRMLAPHGLDSMLYSGLTHEEMQASPDAAVRSLAGEVDILVAGPFVPDHYDERMIWAGSTNQTLICVSDRYDMQTLWAAWARQMKSFSITIGRDGEISASGLQAPNRIPEILRRLASGRQFDGG